MCRTIEVRRRQPNSARNRKAVMNVVVVALEEVLCWLRCGFLCVSKLLEFAPPYVGAAQSQGGLDHLRLGVIRSSQDRFVARRDNLLCLGLASEFRQARAYPQGFLFRDAYEVHPRLLEVASGHLRRVDLFVQPRSVSLAFVRPLQ